jgi:hypothetical protein
MPGGLRQAFFVEFHRSRAELFFALFPLAIGGKHNEGLQASDAGRQDLTNACSSLEIPAMRFHFPLALCLLANLAFGPGLLASDQPQAERKKLIQRVQEQLEVAIADAKHFRELEAPKWAEEAEERATQLKKRLKELSQERVEEKTKPAEEESRRKDPPREKVRAKDEGDAKQTKDGNIDQSAEWLASTKTMLARLRRQAERLRDEGQPQEGLRLAERIAHSMELTQQVAALSEKINQLTKSNQPDEAQAIRKEREALMREVKEILADMVGPRPERPDEGARRNELEQLERKLMEVRRNGPPEAIRDLEVAIDKLRQGHGEHAAEGARRRQMLVKELEALRGKLRHQPANEEEKRRYQGAEARIAELENLLRQMEHAPGHAEKEHGHAKIQERIEHLRIAANHLKQADAHDIAQELMRRADQMQKELEVAMQKRAEGREHAGPLGELHRQLQQMREENEILKREIQEIRRSRN